MITEKEKEKQQLWLDATPKYHYYRCKYLVPDASEILIDRRHAEPNIYV